MRDQQRCPVWFNRLGKAHLHFTIVSPDANLISSINRRSNRWPSSLISIALTSVLQSIANVLTLIYAFRDALAELEKGLRIYSTRRFLHRLLAIPSKDQT